MIDLKAMRADALTAVNKYRGLNLDPGTVINLLDRLEAAEKDAARYRFIRKPAMSQREVMLVANAILCFSEEELDTHIDALMKDEQKWPK